MDDVKLTREFRRKLERGFSLIEVTMAMGVLMVGLLGGILVISVAAANNGRSKLHTTAVTVAESTMERILAIPKKATGPAAQTKMTDCAGNTFTIQTAPGGSPLISDGAFAGSIDYSQPPQPNYSMQYVATCSPGNAVAYDVRWRIDAGPTPSTQLVTVSSKSIAGGAAAAAQFTLPYTLKGFRGDF
jgi:Tfp pilus assembly protein PilV